GLFNSFGEGQAVRKAGQAVAQHLGAEIVLGPNLDSSIDDAQETATRLVRSRGQRRQFQLEEAAADSFTFGNFNFVGRGGRIDQECPDESAPFSLSITLECFGEGLGGAVAARELQESRVHRVDPQFSILLGEYRGGDGQGVEQAEVIRHGKVRSRVQFVRPAKPLNSTRAPSCSLHDRLLAQEGLIPSIQQALLYLVNAI